MYFVLFFGGDPLRDILLLNFLTPKIVIALRSLVCLSVSSL